MNKSLNLPVLHQAMQNLGFSPANLSTRLEVSREAVSKWLNDESFPTPDKLLRLGRLLGLGFEQLVKVPPDTAAPVASFRKKAGRVTKDFHLDNARSTGNLLKRLVPHLPSRPLTQPPRFKNPSCDYNYLQAAAADVRRRMKIGPEAAVQYENLIGLFCELDAIIVPVMWGEKHQHGNALNIYLPDSKTTWVFLNLDSNAIDFNFWMAHELGHSFAPTLTGDQGEDFSDGFAQALLFPEPCAMKLYLKLARQSDVGRRISKIREAAEEAPMSPYTIRLALQAMEENRGLTHIDLGDSSTFMAGVRNFGKGFKTITQALFDDERPKPGDLIRETSKQFGGTFFQALCAFCKAEENSEHFIQRVLDVSPADAKALSEE